MKKLELYGVLGIDLAWIRSHHIDRKQLVLINNILSDYTTISCWMLVCWMIGPFYFINYMNHLQKKRCLSFYYFVDDANCLNESKWSNKSEFNNHLNCIPAWLNKNKIVLNIKKIQSLHFNRYDCRILSLQDQPIENCRNIRHIGIYVDRKLGSGDNKRYRLYKLSHHISIVIRRRDFVPENIRILEYYNVHIKSEMQ